MTQIICVIHDEIFYSCDSCSVIGFVRDVIAQSVKSVMDIARVIGWLMIERVGKGSYINPST